MKAAGNVAVSARTRRIGIVASSVVAVSATLQLVLLVFAHHDRVAPIWYALAAAVAACSWLAVRAWIAGRPYAAAGFAWVAAYQPFLLAVMIVPMFVAFAASVAGLRALLAERVPGGR